MGFRVYRCDECGDLFFATETTFNASCCGKSMRELKSFTINANSLKFEDEGE